MTIERQITNIDVPGNPSRTIAPGIPGWSSYRDLLLLATVAQMMPDNGIIVEAGCYLGRSSYVIGSNLNPSCTFHGIDIWSTELRCFSPEHQLGQFEKSKLKGLKQNVHIAAHLAKTLGSWLPGWSLFTHDCISAVPFKMRIDQYVIPDHVCAVFIDGNHDYDDVIADIRKFNVNEEILLTGDDFSIVFPDVKRAVHEIKEETGRVLVNVPASAMWLLWPLKGPWANKLDIFLDRAERDFNYLDIK